MKGIQNLKNFHEYFIILQKHFIVLPQFNDMWQGKNKSISKPVPNHAVISPCVYQGCRLL